MVSYEGYMCRKIKVGYGGGGMFWRLKGGFFCRLKVGYDIKVSYYKVKEGKECLLFL